MSINSISLVYWQAVEGYGQWGVISIPYDNENATLADIKYNSGYYSMLQFSKYVRKGEMLSFDLVERIPNFMN